MIKTVQLNKTQFQTGIDYSNQEFTNNHSMLQVFRNCNFTGSKFINCTFSYAQFVGCFLNDVIFIGCNLSGSKFYENTTNLVSISDSNLTSTNLIQLQDQQKLKLDNCFKYPNFTGSEKEKIYI
jgi:uncharacterized protein YjbI with pentapeptide repeats